MHDCYCCLTPAGFVQASSISTEIRTSWINFPEEQTLPMAQHAIVRERTRLRFDPVHFQRQNNPITWNRRRNHVRTENKLRRLQVQKTWERMENITNERSFSTERVLGAALHGLEYISRQRRPLILVQEVFDVRLGPRNAMTANHSEAELAALNLIKRVGDSSHATYVERWPRTLRFWVVAGLPFQSAKS